jgi:hypothetical protein
MHWQANGKANAFACGECIGECGGFAISLKRMANDESNEISWRV